MTQYGIVPEGYVRKPIGVILSELEQAMVTEFGPGVIQTPQSPLGQINGLLADALAEIEERNLEIYQSYDPDQAEGTRLDILARLRLIARSGDEADDELRQAITNRGQGRVDIQDLIRAIKNVSGVEFVRVYVNETGEVSPDIPPVGAVSIAIIGGDDDEIGAAVWAHLVPGISTYGNYRVSAEIDGFCRSFSIIRPIVVPVEIAVAVRRGNDVSGCPPPSNIAIKAALEDEWLYERANGMDVSHYRIRSIIERQFANVEVISITGTRDEIDYGSNQTIEIGFIEIADLTAEVVEI